MPNRYRYDMPFQIHQMGGIGRLQTLACVPVCAGDSIQLNIAGALRMPPLARYMTSDPVYDMFFFYVPHRHAYGQDWIDFMKEGVNESTTFDTVSGLSSIRYLGWPRIDGEVPKWAVYAYNAIWNRYFRVPTDDASIRTDTELETAEEGKRYGALIARLKNLWTTGVDYEIADAEREVAVSGGVFDVVDLARVRRQLRTEVDRQWFGQYYNDVMENLFGGAANTDADERPTLLYRKTQHISGIDIDGTGDASLGTYTGKAMAEVRCSLPRKFCPEHGVIVAMAALRFPPVAQFEQHYLLRKPQPSYLEISGDPDLWQAEPPVNAVVGDYFQSSSSANLGYIPFGQWYRYHPSIVHAGFTENEAFPFFKNIPGSPDQARYHQAAEYDNVFQTRQFGDWQFHAAVSMDKSTVVPGPKSSMYAGVNDV